MTRSRDLGGRARQTEAPAACICTITGDGEQPDGTGQRKIATDSLIVPSGLELLKEGGAKCTYRHAPLPINATSATAELPASLLESPTEGDLPLKLHHRRRPGQLARQSACFAREEHAQRGTEHPTPTTRPPHPLLYYGRAAHRWRCTRCTRMPTEQGVRQPHHTRAAASARRSSPAASAPVLRQNGTPAGDFPQNLGPSESFL